MENPNDSNKPGIEPTQFPGSSQPPEPQPFVYTPAPAETLPAAYSSEPQTFDIPPVSPTQASETPKKNNKTLWIVLAVVGGVLLCCCCIIIVLTVLGITGTISIPFITDLFN